jgi:hypothetical protein
MRSIDRDQLVAVSGGFSLQKTGPDVANGEAIGGVLGLAGGLWGGIRYTRGTQGMIRTLAVACTTAAGGIAGAYSGIVGGFLKGTYDQLSAAKR